MLIALSFVEVLTHFNDGKSEMSIIVDSQIVLGN